MLRAIEPFFAEFITVAMATYLQHSYCKYFYDHHYHVDKMNNSAGWLKCICLLSESWISSLLLMFQ